MEELSGRWRSIAAKGGGPESCFVTPRRVGSELIMRACGVSRGWMSVKSSINFLLD